MSTIHELRSRFSVLGLELDNQQTHPIPIMHPVTGQKMQFVTFPHPMKPRGFTSQSSYYANKTDCEKHLRELEKMMSWQNDTDTPA